MAASHGNLGKVAAALAMLSMAGWMLFRFLNEASGVAEKAFFYDLSERKLFVADRGLIPPIKGLNDAREDGVRAVVISTNGHPEEKSTWKIAYLEMYSPELKREMEVAKAQGTSPAMGRTAGQAHRLVKRLEDAQWVSMVTPEGEKLVSEWAIPGPDGLSPVVCTP